MAKDLGFLTAGMIVALAALTMSTSLSASLGSDSRKDLSFTPDFPALTGRPAATHHFFRPGSGIGVEPIMANSNN